MAMPTVVAPEDPRLKLPSGFKEKVSEPAAPMDWLRVDVASVVSVNVPLLASVTIPTSVSAVWLDTSEVPAK